MGNQVGPSSKFKQKNDNTATTTTPPSSSIPIFPALLVRKQSVQSSSNSSGGGGTIPILPPAWDNASFATSSTITLDVQSAISQPISHVAQATCNPEMMIASEVKPFLYLGGDQFVARNRDYLHSLKIKHIVNCAGLSCENYFEDQFTYTTLDLSDTSKECIFNFMLQTITDIESQRLAGNNVLVHCVAGISRSATLVAAYLMFIHGYCATDAIQELRKVRQCVDPNPRFIQELDRFRKRLDWQPSEPTLHRIAPHSPMVRALVPKPVFDLDNPTMFSKPTIRHLHPKYTLVVHSPQDRTLFLWIGPLAEVQYEDEKQERLRSKQTRKQNLPAETYDVAGPRIGLMMTQMDKPYSRLGCNFVHVPTFTECVQATGYTASFWQLLGVPVGTKVDLDFLKSNQQFANQWRELDGDFRYGDSVPPASSQSTRVMQPHRNSVGSSNSTSNKATLTKTTSSAPATISSPTTATATNNSSLLSFGKSLVTSNNSRKNSEVAKQSSPSKDESKISINTSGTSLNSSASSSTPVPSLPALLTVSLPALPPQLPPLSTSQQTRLEPPSTPLLSSTTRPSSVVAGTIKKRPVVAVTTANHEEEEEGTLATTRDVLSLFPLEAATGTSEDKPEPTSNAGIAVKREQGCDVLDEFEEQQLEELRKRNRSQSLNFEATSRKLSSATPTHPSHTTTTSSLSAVREVQTPKSRSKSVGTNSSPPVLPPPRSTTVAVARYATAPVSSSSPSERKFDHHRA
ncbi:hypothetical protein BASA81_012610 [Batrachochytrium salamandrivorans]|nr:hypothetical protein BASA81_012610 [Batrachochytrium salamandrivorans]